MIKLIVASDPSGIIGINGNLPWHYPSDLKRFKTLTMGGVLLVGSKTYKTLPKKMPGREIIVLSKKTFFPNTNTCSDLQTAIKFSSLFYSGKDVWIAGGAEVYKSAVEQNLVDYIDYTTVPMVNYSSKDIVTRLSKNILNDFLFINSEIDENNEAIVHCLFKRK